MSEKEIEDKLKGVCQDCMWLEKIEPIFNQLQQENKQLKERIDKYENPDDMTLYTMWCTEKVKDENKQLKERIKELEEYKWKYEELCK